MVRRILAIDRGIVKRHVENGPYYLADTSRNGRPSMVSHEELIGAITETYQMRGPISTGKIICYIETRRRKSIDRNALWHILCRDPSIKSCRGVYIEEPGLGVTTQAILMFFQHIIEIVEIVRAHCIFNTDEMSHQDWAHPAERASLVPAYHAEKYVHRPVSRASRRMSWVAGGSLRVKWPAKEACQMGTCKVWLSCGSRTELANQAANLRGRRLIVMSGNLTRRMESVGERGFSGRGRGGVDDCGTDPPLNPGNGMALGVTKGTRRDNDEGSVAARDSLQGPVLLHFRRGEGSNNINNTHGPFHDFGYEKVRHQTAQPMRGS
jgi:hypothetical protein